MTDHAPPGRLRPLDYARDIPALLPLLREAFASMTEHDPASQQVLRALEHRAWRLRPGPTTEAQARQGLVPFFGWVWEEQGRPVGLVAVTPAGSRSRRYLLSNIVVHPAHRGRGVGRALVRHALAYIRQRGGEAWLEVEIANVRARHLYRGLGFVEVVPRQEWRLALRVQDARARFPRAVRVTRLTRGQWPQVARWLEEAYPRMLQWRWLPPPLALTWRPGLRGWLARAWRFATHGHRWAVEIAGALVASWAWWPEPGSIQREVYLAAAPSLPADALLAFQHAMSRHLEPVWTFTPGVSSAPEEAPYFVYLDLPPERHAAALQAAGWQPLRQFWWMRDAGG